ncbi:MAG: hypothetical protein IJT01_07210 [Selenomonadaceae bacterium]|nr:hypothetical protein [Selenomonadaceae bacterium]
MKFNIRLGIPEMLALWSSLQDKRQKGTLSKEEASLYKKWGQAMAHLSQNPQHPGLHSHEIPPLSKRYGMKVWQSYLENKTSSAIRMYWVYGPEKQDITVIGLEPHPEDKKHGGYNKVVLSGLE